MAPVHISKEMVKQMAMNLDKECLQLSDTLRRVFCDPERAPRCI